MRTLEGTDVSPGKLPQGPAALAGWDSLHTVMKMKNGAYQSLLHEDAPC